MHDLVEARVDHGVERVEVVPQLAQLVAMVLRDQGKRRLLLHIQIRLRQLVLLVLYLHLLSLFNYELSVKGLED